MNLNSNKKEQFRAISCRKECSSCLKCEPKSASVQLLELSAEEESVFFSQETLILYNRQGVLRLFTSEGKEMLLSECQLFLILPGEEIRLKGEESSSLLLWEVDEIMLFNEYLQKKSSKELPLEEKEEAIPITVNSYIKDMLEHFACLIEEGFACPEYSRNKLSELLLLMHSFCDKELLYRFFHAFHEESYAFKKKVFSERTRARTVEELASKVNLSRSGFHQHFKKVLGCTPSQWLKEEKAQQILADLTLTSKTITEIWIDHGFSSATYFNQFCKKHLGDTPARIRRGRK